MIQMILRDEGGEGEGGDDEEEKCKYPLSHIESSSRCKPYSTTRRIVMLFSLAFKCKIEMGKEDIQLHKDVIMALPIVLVIVVVAVVIVMVMAISIAIAVGGIFQMRMAVVGKYLAIGE